MGHDETPHENACCCVSVGLSLWSRAMFFAAHYLIATLQSFPTSTPPRTLGLGDEGVIYGLYRENGKENGNYYLGFQV